jgi:hypothetical protein
MGNYFSHVAAPILGFFYLNLLVLLIGWTSSALQPSWWTGIFPSGHVAAVTWLIYLHTTGVFFAAIPVAVIARVRAPQEAAAKVRFRQTMWALLSSYWKRLWPPHAPSDPTNACKTSETPRAVPRIRPDRYRLMSPCAWAQMLGAVSATSSDRKTRRSINSETTRRAYPKTFAAIAGWDAKLENLIKRLRCSKCGKRQCSATVRQETKRDR